MDNGHGFCAIIGILTHPLEFFVLLVDVGACFINIENDENSSPTTLAHNKKNIFPDGQGI